MGKSYIDGHSTFDAGKSYVNRFEAQSQLEPSPSKSNLDMTERR